MTNFTTLIPCLLCRQDLDAVPNEHEEHLKKVHKVKFQLDWIIKKTWKERLREISIDNEETINENKSGSNENDEQKNSKSDFIVPDEIDQVYTEYQKEGDSIDETVEDSMTEIKEELTELKHEKMPILQQFTCEKCDKQFKREMNLERHKTLVHGVIIRKEQFTCEECGKQYTKKMYLKHHIAAVHEGVAYRCDQCNISLVNAGGLKRHKESIHEGIRYTCDQCGMSFVQFRSLNDHEASVHKGIKYICDQCTVAPFNNERGLKRHKASVHAGILYECSMCDFKSDDRVSLNKHITIIHKI